MTTGIEGTGFYGQIRYLRDIIRTEKNHLESDYPFSPRQKRKLEKYIAYKKGQLKEVLAKLKKYKIKKTKKELKEKAKGFT
jgi:hypothetical protein